ncbi:restriction endonuclease subunit S [Prevotella sp.]|uniref:restriction endonuclease subunit S n=1 Tax=Prevotella sp. TaxID=59823 RepID=UPI00402878ED
MGDITTNFNVRNKEKIQYPMYSVTNNRGFVPQTEQFEDRDMVGEDIKAYKVIHKDEFAYNPARINVGSIARYEGDKPCMISSLYVCFKSRRQIDSNWLMHLLKTPKMNFYYNINGEGGVRVYLFYPNFARICTSYPGVEEQKKIAKLLSLLDERISTQNKVIDKLQSLIKGINQRVFMNSGINYKLGEICEIRSGYSGNQLLSKKGLKVSRIETISGHKVNMERVGYVAPFESSGNYRLRVGDILFSNINSVEYIGNTAFIDKDYDLYHGMNLLRLTPNNMVVIPFYLYLLLNTNRMLNHFKTVCNKAVSQASINQTELGKTVIQIPPIKTQEQICELYQALYTKLETASHTKSLFQNQKQYMLRQMFI